MKRVKVRKGKVFDYGE